MNYTDIGYNNFLLKPLEASYVEEIGIDSSSSYDQISGSQIKGDKIFSVNKTLQFGLQDENFIVSNGLLNFIKLGKLSDNRYGLEVYDTEQKTIGIWDTDGLVINNLKFFLKNNNDENIISDTGINFENAIITGITSYPDIIEASGSENSTTWYTLSDIPPINLTLTKKRIAFFTVNTKVELNYKSNLELALFINEQRIYPGVEATIYHDTDDNDQDIIPLTFTHMQILNPGSYKIILKKRTDAGVAGRTGWVLSNPQINYMIF